MVKKFSCLLIISCILFVSKSQADDGKKQDKCRGLGLRGGGTKGAFEAGAFRAFVELMEPEEYAYDVIVGVSIGALNAAMISTFEKGHEKEASEFLWNQWYGTAATEIWSNWILGPLEGLWRSSLLDGSLMESKFSSFFTGRSI